MGPKPTPNLVRTVTFQRPGFCLRGGCFLINTAATVGKNTLVENTADADGGGCFFQGPNETKVIGNRLVSNSSAGNGGGYALVLQSALAAGNSMITNDAEVNGGGLHCWSTRPIPDYNYIKYNTRTDQNF